MRLTTASRQKLASAVALAAFALLAALLLFRQTAVTPSFDEMLDGEIVECYRDTGTPVSCAADITQTRLPFYLHALARSAMPRFDPIAVDRTVSTIFILGAVFLLYRLAKREFGAIPAAMFAVLAATNASVLASGRMSLTHSNAIFVFFTAASVTLAWKYSVGGRTRDLLAAAACFGLSMASSLNGAVTVVFFLIAGRLTGERAWSARQMALFSLMSVAIFFAASPIHALPANLWAMLTDACNASQSFPKFNYMGTGAASAPWWFSLTLFTVKLSPWWALVFFAYPILSWVQKKPRPGKSLAVTLWGFIIFFLFVKTLVFGYDAPHHQVHVQLMALVVVAVAVSRLWSMASGAFAKSALAAALALAFAAQSWLILLFFPNFLYFGAQYGGRFIGEFYGPASVHCQDMADMNERVRGLLASGSEVRAVRSLCWEYTDGFKALSKDGSVSASDREFHVFLEGITAFQMKRTAGEDAAISEMMDRCRLEYIHRFPFGFPAYLLYACPAGMNVDPGVLVRLELKD